MRVVGRREVAERDYTEHYHQPPALTISPASISNKHHHLSDTAIPSITQQCQWYCVSLPPLDSSQQMVEIKKRSVSKILSKASKI